RWWTRRRRTGVLNPRWPPLLPSPSRPRPPPRPSRPRHSTEERVRRPLRPRSRLPPKGRLTPASTIPLPGGPVRSLHHPLAVTSHATPRASSAVALLAVLPAGDAPRLLRL